MPTPESASADNARKIPGMLAMLASYEGLFGPYHPQTLALTTSLAVALFASGQRADGRRLLERAVRDLTSHYGRYHAGRIQALDAWSTCLCQEGDWEAALPVQRELLDCRNQVLGQDHPESLAVRNDLSVTFSRVCAPIQT
jgi:Tetratricopeptide repeat